VSEPTVRSWLTRGILERVEGQRPVQVDPQHLQRVTRALAELRHSGQDGDWLQSLADFVEDEAARKSPAVREGLAQYKKGKLEPA
jgi:predicted transcriptional regulator